MKQKLREVLEELSVLQHEILYYRYLDRHWKVYTYSQFSELWKVSETEIKRQEKKAIGKIYRFLMDNFPADTLKRKTK